MMRPWYRSRLFWLGLSVLVFFLWSWADSQRFESWISKEGRGRILVLRQAEGTVSFLVVSYAGSGPAGSGFNAARSKVEADPYYEGPAKPRWFGPAFHHWVWDIDEGAERQETWEVAWWVIAAGYLVIWTGILVFWQRRRARLWNASAAGCAEPPARSST
jgi:phosphatidylglycerophosphate synthase